MLADDAGRIQRIDDRREPRPAQMTGTCAQVQSDDERVRRPQRTVARNPFVEPGAAARRRKGNHLRGAQANSAPPLVNGLIRGIATMSDARCLPEVSKFSKRITSPGYPCLTAHSVPSAGSTAIAVRRAPEKTVGVDSSLPSRLQCSMTDPSDVLLVSQKESDAAENAMPK